MKRLFVLLLLCGAALGQDYVGLGQRFANLVKNGQYASATAMFDGTMKRLVSEARLGQSWEVMIEKHGPFQKFGQPTLRKVEQFQVVLIPTIFERHRVQMKVVLTARGEVAGYFWVPYVASRPPPYLDTKVREVPLSVGTWKLPALLTFPAGPPRAGIVLVQGSGPSDKDETIGPNKPFRDLAHGLAGQGIATLRYDKRTIAHGLMMSLGRPTVEDEVIEDALAALALLRSRPELKGRPIVLLGHSLGAILGPEMARRDGQLHGLILMAGPVRPFEEALIDQLTYLGGQDPEIKKVIASIQKLASLPDDDKSILGAPAYYWREVKALQDRSLATAQKLPCPILVLQGGRDYQATEQDYRLWMAGLQGRKVKGQLFPRLNHLFAPGEGKATPAEYEEQNYVDPPVIQAIGAWIIAAVLPSAQAR